VTVKKKLGLATSFIASEANSNLNWAIAFPNFVANYTGAGPPDCPAKSLMSNSD